MSNRNPTFLLDSHPFRLSLLAFHSSSQILSLSRSLPFTTDQPREPHGSPLFVLFSPSFYPDSRDSHEYSSHDLLGRLGREKSSLVYRPFSSPFSIFSHSYSSYLIFVCSSCRFIISCRFRSQRTRWKMETLIKLRVAVTALMWFICMRLLKKNRGSLANIIAVNNTLIIIIPMSSTVKILESICYYKHMRIITKQWLSRCIIDTIFFVPKINFTKITFILWH